MPTNPLIAKLEQRDRLSHEETAILIDACSPPRQVAAGEDMIHEGDRPTESTLMLAGFSARYNALRDGARQISAIHIPGDFIDLHSLLLHPMDHGITALSGCTVTTVPHKVLREVTERFPHLTRLLWLSTLIDAAILRRWHLALGRLPAVAHLAHLLCELTLRLRAVGLAQDGGFDMPLTQAQVADVLGLSVVHANRVVQQLKRERLIAWTGRKVSILDWDRLAALAEFDPDYLQLHREPR